MNKTARFSSIFFVLFIVFYTAYNAKGAENMQTYPIIIKVDNIELEAVVENSESGQDFYALLPLTLNLSDYNKTEKISDLPKKLTTTNAPAGITPKKSDITYFAPWGNLAIFYQDFRYSNGLIKIGHINGDLTPLMKAENFSITIMKKK